MFSKLGTVFLRGLVTVLPIGVTLYLCWWLGTGSESVLGGVLKQVLPADSYIPGMGLVAGFFVVLLIGLSVQAWVVRKALEWFEQLMLRLPMVKTLYGAVSDFLGYFSSGSKAEFSKVVLVNVPAVDGKLVGFVTADSLNRLKAGEVLDGHVAVYMPMSYQIGGYTLFLKSEQLKPLDISFEDAMRFAMTAGISK